MMMIYLMALLVGVHVVFVSYQFTRIIPMAFVTCAGRSTVVSVSSGWCSCVRADHIDTNK